MGARLAGILLSLLVAGCVSEGAKAERQYRKDRAAALQANTVESWLVFAKKHPSQKYEAESRAERLAHAHASKANTDEALEEYLSVFPSGKHAREFRVTLATRQFAQAEEEDTLEAYQRFLVHFPESEQARIARNRADLRSLIRDLETAKSFRVEVRVKGPDGYQFPDEARQLLVRPIELALRAAGLAPVESNTADIIVQVEARLRWIGQVYGLGGIANEGYRVPDAGASLTGTTTVVSSSGRQAREFEGRADPANSILMEDNKVLGSGPHADLDAAKATNCSDGIIWVIVRARGVEPLVRIHLEEPRLLPACLEALRALDRKETLLALWNLVNEGPTRAERSSAATLMTKTGGLPR